jgi:hypothetical protein
MPWPGVGSLKWPASPTSAQPGPADSRKKPSREIVRIGSTRFAPARAASSSGQWASSAAKAA